MSSIDGLAVGGQETSVREDRTKRSEERIPTLDDVLIHIFLLFFNTGHQKPKVVIFINHTYDVITEPPWFSIFVERYICLGASHNNFGFASIEP